jgi:hypothetical protein
MNIQTLWMESSWCQQTYVIFSTERFPANARDFFLLNTLKLTGMLQNSLKTCRIVRQMPM